MTEASAEWRSIPGYDGLYQISNHGQVKSLARRVERPQGSYHRRETLLRFAADQRGYRSVHLSKDGNPKFHSVHRLVAWVFLRDTWFPGAEVCHNDGNPENNHVSNLRWGTRAENVHDSVLHGTHANSGKTHCSKGHPFTDANTCITVNARSGGPQRNCRKCNTDRVRRIRATKKLTA
jgi:hypothetical protein